MNELFCRLLILGFLAFFPSAVFAGSTDYPETSPSPEPTVDPSTVLDQQKLTLDLNPNSEIDKLKATDFLDDFIKSNTKKEVDKKREAVKKLQDKKTDFITELEVKLMRYDRAEKNLEKAKEELKDARNDAQGEYVRKKVEEMKEEYKKATKELGEGIKESKKMDQEIDKAWKEYKESASHK